MKNIITISDKETVQQLVTDLRKGISVKLKEILPFKEVVLRTLQRDSCQSFNLMKRFSGDWVYLATWGHKNAIEDKRDECLLCGLDL